MKYYLSSFGLHNPFIKCELADHLVYPVAMEFEKNLDLDYGMLLVADGFVIDKGAYDFIISDKRKSLEPMANSLKILFNEGFLELFDLGANIAERNSTLIKKTEVLANDVLGWIGLVRNQWKTLSEERNEFVSHYGMKGKELINSNHFTLINAIQNLEGNITPELIEKYKRITFSKRHDFSLSEKQILIEIIKPLICHLLLHDFARFESKSIILDWDDSTPYYDKLYAMRWDLNELDMKIPAKSRDIFNLILPQVQPNMVSQVLKFIKNKKSVTSLREEIILLINNGTIIDEKWLANYQNELIKSGLRKDKVMKKIRWGSSILGLFIPGGSFLTDVAVEGASELIDNTIENKLTSHKFDWYYAMQDSVISKV